MMDKCTKAYNALKTISLYTRDRKSDIPLTVAHTFNRGHADGLFCVDKDNVGYILFLGTNSALDWTYSYDEAMVKGRMPIDHFNNPAYKELENKTFKIHRGWRDIISMDLASFQRAVDFIKCYDKIIIAGQSLGATLATLFAFAYINILVFNNYEYKDVSIYLHNSLKIGNRQFVKLFNNLYPNTYNIHYGNDIGEWYPPWPYYKQVGKLVRYGDKSRFFKGSTYDHIALYENVSTLDGLIAPLYDKMLEE